MCIVHRTHKRLPLILAAFLPDRTRVEQPFVKLVPIFKTIRRHPRRRANGGRGVVWERTIERPIFTAEESCGGECLEFLPFPEIETLPDIDKRRDRRIARPERAGKERAKMRRGDGLRRHVAGVPVVLMPGMQDESKVRGLRGVINVPRSITLAIFSNPSENRTPSTAVGMLGKVESTPFGSMPFSKGAYRFGSNVSVCAMPPAIQSTITVSAVGAIFSNSAAPNS